MDYFGISDRLRNHYAQTYKNYGATTRGVDWSDSQEKERLRLSKVLGVTKSRSLGRGYSVLDVGCGYGAAYEAIRREYPPVKYTGIDLVSQMIEDAQNAHSEARFICGDFLNEEFDNQFDYVICSGILTQKLETENEAMFEYLRKLVSKMFSLSKIGISFNVMSLFSNFQTNNLFYLFPQDIIDFVCSDLSQHFVIDHSYGLFEFTTYVYHEGESV